MAYSIILIVVMIAIFYFMLIRPENKKKKAAEELRNSLKVGDEVTTIGGIIGTVWRRQGRQCCDRNRCGPGSG